MLARRGQKALGEAIKADCDGGVFDINIHRILCQALGVGQRFTLW